MPSSPALIILVAFFVWGFGMRAAHLLMQSLRSIGDLDCWQDAGGNKVVFLCRTDEPRGQFA